MHILYRVMCETERDKTVANGKPSFDTKRFKWFSRNINWVRDRVQGGKFNNSNFKADRYTYLLKFAWDGCKYDFESTNEIQFDRRRNPTIRFIAEIT